MPSKDLQNLLHEVVAGIIPWSSISRHHFRSKARQFLLQAFLSICPSYVYMGNIFQLFLFVISSWIFTVVIFIGDGDSGDPYKEVWFCSCSVGCTGEIQGISQDSLGGTFFFSCPLCFCLFSTHWTLFLVFHLRCLFQLIWGPFTSPFLCQLGGCYFKRSSSVWMLLMWISVFKKLMCYLLISISDQVRSPGFASLWWNLFISFLSQLM